MAQSADVRLPDVWNMTPRAFAAFRVAKRLIAIDRELERIRAANLSQPQSEEGLSTLKQHVSQLENTKHELLNPGYKQDMAAKEKERQKRFWMRLKQAVKKGQGRAVPGGMIIQPKGDGGND